MENEIKMSKRGYNSATTNLSGKKKIRVRLNFILIPCTKYQDPVSNGSLDGASVTRGDTVA